MEVPDTDTVLVVNLLFINIKMAHPKTVKGNNLGYAIFRAIAYTVSVPP
jgi:hypothetical protein